MMRKALSQTIAVGVRTIAQRRETEPSPEYNKVSCGFTANKQKVGSVDGE